MQTGGACANAPLPNYHMSWFGKVAIGWGTGPDGARKRLRTITREHLEKFLVDIDIAVAWKRCYRREYIRTNFRNAAALYRAELMDRAVELLGGTSDHKSFLDGLAV